MDNRASTSELFFPNMAPYFLFKHSYHQPLRSLHGHSGAKSAGNEIWIDPEISHPTGGFLSGIPKTGSFHFSFPADVAAIARIAGVFVTCRPRSPRTLVSAASLFVVVFCCGHMCFNILYIYMVTPPCMTYSCLSKSRWGPLADNKKVKKKHLFFYGCRLKNNTVNH